MTQRWALVSKFISMERPEVKGLFINGICVGSYFGYKQIYIANTYCYKSARIHNSVMVDTIANCKRILEENYVKSRQECTQHIETRELMLPED